MTDAEQIEELKSEIAIDDKIMAEWAKVLDAIPPCPAHGPRCMPHSVEWIESVKTLGKIIFEGSSKT